MKNYDTLSEAINDLEQKGYVKNFNINQNCIECDTLQLNPDLFEISEVHRFEADTDPGASTILYAIESINGAKGLLVNAYGAYSNGATDELIEKLRVKH